MATESKQSTGAEPSAMPWLDDIKKLIDKYQLPGVDVAALVDWQRKDMDILRFGFDGVKRCAGLVSDAAIESARNTAA